MPKSLAKVTKKLNKKKGNISSLNENSRDAQKLRRAGARGEKLDKLATARAKANKPHLNRILFFKGAAEAATGPVGVETIHNLVQSYLSRDDAELAEVKSQRRPGRPSNSREDLLKHRVLVENREYDNGYWIPNMQDEDNLGIMRRWDGGWSSLNTMKFVRLARDGNLQQSSFPPKGQS